MSDKTVQLLKKKFNLNSKKSPGQLNGFSDQEQEEIDQPMAMGLELTPGEYRAALFTLCISLSILSIKLIFGNKDVLHSAFTKAATAKRRELASHPMPPIMPVWLVETVFTIESTWRSLRLIILPIMWSVFFTFYTWFMIYKNIRQVPGIETPTPLTPTRLREANAGGSFCLDYFFPLAISFCGFLLMLYLSHL